MKKTAERLFGRLIVGRRKNFYPFEMENRFRNYTVFCLVGLPTMLLFGLAALMSGQKPLALIVGACFSGLLAGWISLYHCIGGAFIFRANSLLYSALLIYMGFAGGEDGSKLLWTYTFPLAAFFLLGQKEGSSWCIALFLVCQVFLWNPLNMDLPHNYPAAFSLRFCLSFIFITIITYSFERFRQIYRTEIEKQNQALEKEIRGRKSFEHALAKSEERYKAVFTQAAEGILILDTQGQILECNSQFAGALKTTVDQLIGRCIFDSIHPEDLVAVPSQIPNMIAGKTISVERRIQTMAGDYLIFEISGSPLEDQSVLLVCRDITRRKNAEAALEAANQKLDRQANIDGLTRIPNRRKFDTTVVREWKRLRREQEELALVLCDIDYFKQFNDFYGHQEGDTCLARVGGVLKSILKRPEDLAARVGGEEFALLLPNTSMAGGVYLAESARQKILELNIPHNGSKVAQSVSMSFGVAAMEPSGSFSPEDLYHLADKALYTAKENGRNRVETANLK